MSSGRRPSRVSDSRSARRTASYTVGSAVQVAAVSSVSTSSPRSMSGRAGRDRRTGARFHDSPTRVPSRIAPPSRAAARPPPAAGPGRSSGSPSQPSDEQAAVAVPAGAQRAAQEPGRRCPTAMSRLARVSSGSESRTTSGSRSCRASRCSAASPAAQRAERPALVGASDCGFGPHPQASAR